MHFAVPTRALLYKTILVQEKHWSPGCSETPLNSRETKSISNINGVKAEKKEEVKSLEKKYIFKLSSNRSQDTY